MHACQHGPPLQGSLHAGPARNILKLPDIGTMVLQILACSCQSSCVGCATFWMIGRMLAHPGTGDSALQDLPMSLWRQDLAPPFPALLLKVVHTILSQASSLRTVTEESQWGRTLQDLSKQVGPQQP